MAHPAKPPRVLALLLALVMLAAASAQSDPAGLLHRPAPRFQRTSLEGRRVDLADYRGKVVLLTFWATWCAPCLVEMPRLIDWQNRYRSDGLQVLAVSLDDDAEPVRALTAERHLNYPVMMGDANLARAYGRILGLPVSFLIDRHGKIAAVYKGETDPTTIESGIKPLLAAH
ncbi:TlpA family protein disulfide reductase [Acidobacteria bacterium AB60]|nr:TlpA family protein disulfide reductase [Acidobacteria bacterium AB60]